MTSQRSKITRYILSLPIVSTADLPDEHVACHICMEDFKAQNARTLELPVRLPCSHILGTICMINWLSSNGDKSPRGCPMCRAELLPQTQPPPFEPRSGQSRRAQLRRRDPAYAAAYERDVVSYRILEIGGVPVPRQSGLVPPAPAAPRPPLAQRLEQLVTRGGSMAFV